MLQQTVFRTSDFPVAERFGCWRELMAEKVCPMDMGSEHERDFQAETRLLEIGAVRVWPATVPAMSWQRTPKLIRQSDPEFYHLSLPLAGSVGVRQAGREELHGPFDMHVIDTSRPGWRVNSMVKVIGLGVPKRLVPLNADRVGALLVRQMSAREGVGALLAGFLTGLAEQSDSLHLTDGQRLEAVIVDLLTATLAHHLDTEDSLPPETRTRTLTRRIRTFIQQHLSDPDLNPRSVAAAHHISVSYLHRLFQSEGTTVGAWIRGQRLEAARRDLTNPALRGMPLHEIAVRWGFTYHASFTRAFQAAYGLPPREYRHHRIPEQRTAGAALAVDHV